jgi:siroheme synthase-like protein
MPAFLAALTIRGLPVVVVGGGPVAARKAAALLKAGAGVRVIAPEATTAIRTLARRRRLRWLRARYRPGCLRGAWLVVAATSDRSVNARIARDAARRRLFANIVDDPGSGTLTVPAVARRGSIAIAVSTDGRSPTLAVRLRDRMARRITAADVRQVRRAVRKR